MDLFGSMRRRVKGACLAGLLLLPVGTRAPLSDMASPQVETPANTVANLKLRRIQAHLEHLPNVRSTLLCETPGARIGIVHLKQIHAVPAVDKDLEAVMRSEYPDLAEHALAVYQEQYVLVGMIQDDIYEIVLALRRDLGMRSIFLEGWGIAGTGGMAAQEYANNIARARERGLFSPSPLGSDMFPREPETALIAARLEELQYVHQAGIERDLPSERGKMAAIGKLLAIAETAPFSEDFLAVRYAFGAGTRAAADFGLAIRPFEDVQYTAQVQQRYREARCRGTRPDWAAIADGREDMFIKYLQLHARDKEVVVTTLGAAHALGGPSSCPTARPGTFDNRLSFQDNLANWNRNVDLPMSVLEVEPLMERNIDEQSGYNVDISQMLVNELLMRRALRDGTTPEQQQSPCGD